ncbi:hypothetical protein [Ancylobacter polymorphus]|uniref:DUF2267 domain-containing protein n=1 Tax=Ancylobacter polymorphus TaxID=223390 RepID=A0ABU0BC72_9HYPH|nr:hypothetical protein [Ancylobacter polymorphus]MDQ0302918.1 hypothetical protein [Ancylobacter polymorphus]
MTLLTDKQREEVARSVAVALWGMQADVHKMAEAALTAALPAIERAVLEKLSDPVFVRLNILSGGIARPDDLVWLHDTDGPVAAKVREVGRALMKECLNEAAAVAYQQDADHGAANTGGADEVLNRLRALAGGVG